MYVRKNVHKTLTIYYGLTLAFEIARPLDASLISTVDVVISAEHYANLVNMKNIQFYDQASKIVEENNIPTERRLTLLYCKSIILQDLHDSGNSCRTEDH